MAKEVKHTPGEWLVNPVSAWVEVAGEDAPICALLWPTDLRSEAETLANGYLIAGAKGLLAELERIAETADALGLESMAQTARAAIAKATAA